MKSGISMYSALMVVAVFAIQLNAQSITYQGELSESGNLSNGTFDFQFQLYDGPSVFNGSPVGSAISVNNVQVTDGRFTVQLTFPIESLDNSNRWLRIRVDGTWLSPFQPISRTPYAIQTRGIQVNAILDVAIGTAGFPQFNFGKLFVDSAQALFAIDAVSDEPMFPTLNATNTSDGPVLWAVSNADVTPAGGGIIVLGSETGPNLGIDQNEIMARNNGQPVTLGLNAQGGNVIVGALSGGSSRLITPVLQITGGSDLSELFDVNATSKPLPGMVVSIDANNPGQLIPATEEYDRKVAGIISGAGGVATGMTMGQQGSVADGEFPVALTGRVYCLVDAAEQGIEPGDMLTSSSVPGHAMKATDLSRAQGAILGKAMSSLEKGQKGLVLVLVNLQ